MSDKKPLACSECGDPWQIECTMTGVAYVRPGHWWRPTTGLWIARCVCRVLTGEVEGDLYKQMGVRGYA